MDKMQVAARFIAFTAFLNSDDGNPASPGEAGNFARNNWTAYLPYATEDLGTFLTERSVLRPPSCSPPLKRRQEPALDEELSMAR
jgi:hypothetical protein